MVRLTVSQGVLLSTAKKHLTEMVDGDTLYRLSFHGYRPCLASSVLCLICLQLIQYCTSDNIYFIVKG